MTTSTFINENFSALLAAGLTSEQMGSMSVEQLQAALGNASVDVFSVNEPASTGSSTPVTEVIGGFECKVTTRKGSDGKSYVTKTCAEHKALYANIDFTIGDRKFSLGGINVQELVAPFGVSKANTEARLMLLKLMKANKLDLAKFDVSVNTSTDINDIASELDKLLETL